MSFSFSPVNQLIYTVSYGKCVCDCSELRIDSVVQSPTILFRKTKYEITTVLYSVSALASQHVLHRRLCALPSQAPLAALLGCVLHGLVLVFLQHFSHLLRAVKAVIKQQLLVRLNTAHMYTHMHIC